MSSYTRKLALLFAATLMFFTFTLQAQVNFPLNSEFKYLKGIEAGDLAANWNTAAFDDASWASGQAPFWYGDGANGTLLDDMENSYPSFYLRTTFTASSVELIPRLILQVDYDDGFILWINGKNVFAQNAPLIPANDAFATGQHESGSLEMHEFLSGDVDLLEGENQLAVQVFNISPESSDIHFNMSLSATKEQPVFPDSIHVSFNHQSGYYQSPFSLQITPENDTLDVYYTLDGSHPGYSPTAVKLSGGGSIMIDPSSSAGGGVTPAVVVRTSIREDGFIPSYPLSRTFIFLDAVLDQGHPGGIWPVGDINSQVLDFPMDQNITRGSRYGSKMIGSLLDLPSISIVTANENLFGASQGIYVNAEGHGPEWERECSVELIYPDSIGFQTNAGLRIRGGWSRHPEFPKHSFRLFFRSMYGDSKLDYPLFGEEGAAEFDKIDLRTSQNYAWAQGDARNTMLREVFSRDLQRDMGQPYTRSRYYHLYLNGMYWGLFQTQERSEARFASSYFGGAPEDYDVVKVNTEDFQYSIEATDGNLELWQEIYNLTNQDLADMTNYYKLEGRNSAGNISRSLSKLVDIDNLIDYMIGIFYTGNFDAPTSSFMGNAKCNNFYAIKERNNPTTGFVFFNHDAEHSLFSDPAPPGIGIQEDRVNIADRSDNLKMTLAGFEYFHPQWLHYKLTENDEYRIRFNDRAYKYMKPGGILTEDKCLERFNERFDQIEQAIIAESGRWGDARRSNALNRDDHWIPEVNKVRNDFFPERLEIVTEQLMTGRLYSTVEAPLLEINGDLIWDDVVTIHGTVNLKIIDPGSIGTLYYTINGGDPRAPGGEPSWLAERADDEAQMEISGTTLVRARLRINKQWSALSEMKIMLAEEDYSGLKITEIHYHPLDSINGGDTISNQDYEFLEFRNTGEHGINLTGLQLDSAVRYTFPDNEILLPREFFVVVSKPVKFFERYGKIASGNYSGNLSNGGELILLKNAQDDIVLEFRYDDQHPWPVHADGIGYSLVPTKSSPELYPGLPDYWIRSSLIGGSPFANDGNSDMTFIVESKVSKLSIYPNPTRDLFVVKISDLEQYEEIEIGIYDLSGTKVFETVVTNGSRIDISEESLNSGVYVIDVVGHAFHERSKLIYIRE